MEPNSKFRKVNASLDKQPKIGPFPADQFLPWIAIAGISYYLFKVALGLSWIWTGILAAWGMSTWWILTGSHSWRFLSKFIPVPNWVCVTLRVSRESGERHGKVQNRKETSR